MSRNAEFPSHGVCRRPRDRGRPRGGIFATAPFSAPPSAAALFAALLVAFALLLAACNKDDAAATAGATPDMATALTVVNGDRQVVLSWTAPATAATIEPTHYSIFRATTPAVNIFPLPSDGSAPPPPDEQLAEVELARIESSATTYTDLTTLNYVAYYYRVLAINDAGPSAPSGEVLALPKDFSAEVQKLRAADAAADQRFGHAVAMGAGFALVGTFNVGTSTVHAYDRQADGGWSVVEQFSGSETSVGDSFGGAIALEGTTAVIGAPNDVDGDTGAIAGAAYIFERQTDGSWSETAILRPSDGQDSDQFGISVAISGAVIVVGAEREAGGTGDALPLSGAAYVFEEQSDGTWLETAILRASDAQASDSFGASVAVSGTVVIVGAPLEDGGTADATVDAGAAYVFEKQSDDTWAETAILQAASLDTLDNYGISVTLVGDVAMIGAPGDRGVQDTLFAAGVVYVLEGQSDGTWTESTVLVASDGGTGEFFGSSIARGTDYTVIGARLGNDFSAGDPNLFNTGAAYVFAQDSDGEWSEVAILGASDGQTGDEFGISVAVYGNEILVGADREDGGLSNSLDNSGSVYFY